MISIDSARISIDVIWYRWIEPPISLAKKAQTNKKVKYMKLNKKQTEQIAVLANRFDTSVEEMTKTFETVITSKKLEKFEPKSRSGAAIRKLHAIYVNKKNKDEFGVKTEPVTFRVEAKEEPTSFKRADGTVNYRSSVYVTSQQVDGKPLFTVLALWGDANEINPELVNGKTYKANLAVAGGRLSLNNPVTLEEVDTELPEMADVITGSYPVIPLEDAGMNISDDWNDLKLIKGVIAGGWSKETKAGNMMGFLKLIAEESDDMMIIKFSRIYEQVNFWDEGSLVYVLGQITPPVYEDESGELKFDLSAWGNLIVPIEAIEKEIEEPEEEDDETFDVEDETGDDDEEWNVEDDDEDWG